MPICYLNKMSDRYHEQLVQLLRRSHTMRGRVLCEALGGIHKSTLTRALKGLGPDLVVLGKGRRVAYGLRRPLRGNAHPIPVYQIDTEGRGVKIGLLQAVYPQGTAFQCEPPWTWPLIGDMQEGWFDGLPYLLYDMRHQGFLGRQFAKRSALMLGVSEDPDAWNDDDIMHVLSISGIDQPGDLIVGEVAYRQYLAGRVNGQKHSITDTELTERYPQLAETALTSGVGYSSAGGECPKFTANRWINGEPTEVIVKFSGMEHSPTGIRAADLLVCEQIASQVVLQQLGISAATSRIYRIQGRTFLEVDRFDRHGLFGRSPVCTLQSINAAVCGHTGPWHIVAAGLRAAGFLAVAEFRKIALLWWFGKLIGNTDMHEGNLAFRPGLVLAPIYDMLPMFYAPTRSGDCHDMPLSPDLPLPEEQSLWFMAAEAACQFWESCARDTRISVSFQQVCRENHENVARLMRQLD